MIYTQWHNQDEAKALEASLVEGLIEALSLPPMAREKHYEALFKSFRDVVDDQQDSTEPTIITNINPYRFLFENNHLKELLKLQKDCLPLSGDGYLKVTPAQRSTKTKYFLHNRHLPTLMHSLGHFGIHSLLLNIPTIRALETFAKCYSESLYASSYIKEGPQLSDQVNRLIRQTDFPLDNLTIWVERVINAEDVMNMLMEKAGINNNLQDWQIPDKEEGLRFAEQIVKMLSLYNSQYLAFYALVKVEGDITDTETYFPKLVQSIVKQSDSMNTYYPEVAKHLLGNLIALTMECNFHWEGNAALRKNMVNAFKDKDIAEQIHHSKAKKIMEYLDKPDLVSALSKRGKRDKLQDDLDL